MAVSHGTGWEPPAVSVQGQRPGGFPGRHWCSIWAGRLMKLASAISRGQHQPSPARGQDRQETNAFPLDILASEPQPLEGLSPSINVRNPSQACPADSRSHQVDNIMIDGKSLLVSVSFEFCVCARACVCSGYM